MIFRLPIALTVVLSLVTVAFAGPAKKGGRKCGNHFSTEDITAKESKFADDFNKTGGATRLATKFRNHTIQVHFHVIYAEETPEQGYVPDKQIIDQMNVLNKDYAGTGLHFNLTCINRAKNADWYNKVAPDTPEQAEMKQELRVGNGSTLNIYTVSFENEVAGDLLGYATFPADYQGNPKDDGVVARHSTLPGGGPGPANLGRTLTHEVGHWVGLYHTFEGGCDGKGDFVSDTPAEAEPAYGCPSKRDTCKNRKGLDPIRNFMDYTDDSCMDNFTSGQATRLRHQIHTYRDIPL